MAPTLGETYLHHLTTHPGAPCPGCQADITTLHNADQIRHLLYEHEPTCPTITDPAATLVRVIHIDPPDPPA
jgi:hypothetical protein